MLELEEEMGVYEPKRGFSQVRVYQGLCAICACWETRASLLEIRKRESQSKHAIITTVGPKRKGKGR